MIDTTDLKIVLLQRRLKQKEIAERLGISPQRLCDILHGRRAEPMIRKRLITEIGLPGKLINLPSPRSSAGTRRRAA